MQQAPAGRRQQHIQRAASGQQVKAFPLGRPGPSHSSLAAYPHSAAGHGLCHLHHNCAARHPTASCRSCCRQHQHSPPPPATSPSASYPPAPPDPISLSHLTHSIIPGHPATFLASHPIHIIPRPRPSIPGLFTFHLSPTVLAALTLPCWLPACCSSCHCPPPSPTTSPHLLRSGPAAPSHGT